MKRIIIYSTLALMTATSLFSCQNKDYEEFPIAIQPLAQSQFQSGLQGNNFVISWGNLQGNQKMQITRYANGSLNSTEVVEGTSYTHENLETNVDYTYVLKATDGDNFSQGVVIYCTREGATKIESVTMSQIDTETGYNANVEWSPVQDATSIEFKATNGTREIKKTFDNKTTSFVIEDVKDAEEWKVELVAANEKGKANATSASLKIGKTTIGFLSAYATENELINTGDDDEASAWLWLKSEYPSAKYVYFGDISTKADLDQFRVLFWMRDLEGVGEGEVFAMPEIVMAATPAVKEWYKDGGSILLWSHAIPYIETLGRLPEGTIMSNDHAIGTGAGGWNPDIWRMAVSCNPGSKFKKDFSSHPIYKGMETTETDRCKLIAMKGAGWTEDHNCLFFNYPSALTGKGSQDEICYDELTQKYGIYPLGTWDSQFDWVSQLNIWEAQQGNTDFKGTILCIGNGSCEFSLKNADGSKDVSAHPSNNPYQDNVLKLAKNSLEYLKTR